MEPQNLAIDNLRKVALVLEVGNSQEAFTPLKDPKTLEFIYGVATHGITPFERLLYQKSTGDEVMATVDLDNADEYFGPLSHGIQSWLQGGGELVLKVGVQSVSTPADREIVKALASGGGCGCGCNC